MAREYDVITFDCYGTLIDWENGIRDAFAAAGAPVDRSRIIPVYSEVEPEVEHERYRAYREVLAESAVRTARRLGWAIADGSFLAASLPSWKPFPDTNPALERLRAAGYRLGILSNVDDDLLEGTRAHFTVPFEILVTAQGVGSYKPAHGHFRVARERIGGARWLHAAQSNFHDIVPANALGIPSAWINRHGSAGERPTHEFRNLEELANAMTKAAPV